MMYNKLVEECFFSPVHAGVIDLNLPNTVHFRMGQGSKGVLIDLYMHYTQEGFIQTLRFKARGNPYLIASLEWVCRQLEGQYLDGSNRPHYQELIQKFDIPTSQYPLAIQVGEAFKELIALM